jgi:tetratricopeptide (TPR) repeat protein
LVLLVRKVAINNRLHSEDHNHTNGLPVKEGFMDISTLHKNATAYKNAGDIENAISLLYQAKLLANQNPISCPIDSWLRLPLFLQQAGRFNEAMAEFNDLLENPPITREKDSPLEPLVLEMLTHADMCAIYDKMRLACDRENRFKESEQYEKLSKKHDREWVKLNRKLNR